MTQVMNPKKAHDALHTGQEVRLLNEAELDQVGGGIEFSAFGYTFAGGESFAPGHNYASITNSRGIPIYYTTWQS
ncbi:hypothetical protein ACKUFS_27035 [Pseudomonas cannabina]|uniref:Uncharacterized protein n=1 Tax=Pseudomonas syringae pv. maculicola str. ES4326 TaxID=629265 RepID=A0A8T8BXJ9_PSEYM|nr:MULTISPECIES: hypothetical protein [Pseudomonas syringae group]KPB72046.1 Uncharacterized protein AC507_3908 [Pseudomonas syringae pv. maculicola]QHE95847.1 hypothetical protein PMA4326_003935 [Pseudomonas syringae pv. maculicola str. ES4326]QQN22866.1 hypothetical protein JGS08_04050 [Pseudomonas cannabina pv. alisalensis]UBY96495.1 hypothetical protein LCG56_21370 [Pseudomonas cannabina pv. alisalensis]